MEVFDESKQMVQGLEVQRGNNLMASGSLYPQVLCHLNYLTLLVSEKALGQNEFTSFKSPGTGMASIHLTISRASLPRKKLMAENIFQPKKKVIGRQIMPHSKGRNSGTFYMT